MKKRLISLFLVLALAFLCVPWTSAAESMAFVAVNDTIPMTLSGDNAAYYNGSTLYIPYMAFDANPNGVVVSYNRDKDTFVLFTRARRLVYDLAENTVTDENDKTSDVELVYRGGILYLPASAASHFGVTATLLTSQSGYSVLRFTNGSQVYDDEMFVEKAENLIAYMVEQEGGQTQGPSQGDDGSGVITFPNEEPEETEPAIVYLAFAGDAVNQETLDALTQNKVYAAFFLTARQFREDKELVRAIFAGGHTIGVTAEPGEELLSNTLAEANDAMMETLFHKSLFALVPQGASRDQIGYFFLEEPITLTASTALTIPEIPQLLVCRANGAATIQTLAAANASMPQLLETTFLS